MINIVFGDPGVGKTSFLCHLAKQSAYDLDRNNLQKSEILKMRAGGFAVTPLDNCAVCNFDTTFKQFGLREKHATKLNPFRMGFNNPFVKTQFIAPYSFICIAEGQKYYDARLSRFFPSWVSRFFEAHRHYGLDIYIDCQRGDLIDLNIRSLSRMLEVLGTQIDYDKIFGKVKRVVWKLREFSSLQDYELYMSSGKQKQVYKEYEVVEDSDIFSMYDSCYLKPKFYEGHFYDDYFRQYQEAPEENIEAYIKWLEAYNDEMPKDFYRKVA